MASSGSFNTNAYEVRYLTFNWSVISQSIANNQTTISWSLTGAGSSPSTWYMSGNFKVVIDGVTVYSSGTRIQLKSGTQVASGTYTFTHNNYGDRSFSASAEAGIYYVAVNCRGSGSWSLPNIPRSATITGATDFTDIQNPTIYYSNPAGNSVSSLQACISLTGARDDISYRNINKTGSSYTFNLTEAERDVLRNASKNSNTLRVLFFVQTVINGTYYRSNTARTMTIVNANPSIESISYEDTNTSMVNITNNNQVIIQNNSTILFNFSNLKALKYATLKSVAVTLNGVTQSTNLTKTSLSSSSINFGTVNSAYPIDATIVVMDSRGNKATYTKEIEIEGWSLPTAIINIQRESNFYSETNINVNADYSSLDNKNTINIKVRYKKVSDSNWGAWISLQDAVTIQETLDNNYAWDFQVVVQDKIGSTTYNLTLNRGIPITFFDREKRSVGVNCFPSDTESLEVSGENILTRIAGFGELCKSAPTSDWNTACGTRSGFYMGADMSNSPSGNTVANWWWVIHLAHNDKYQRQIAFSFLENVGIYTRIMNNGNWGNWTQV